MKILICGDIIIYNDKYNHNNNIYGDFSKIISSSDIAIYNQEFPITCSSKGYSTKEYGLRAKTNPDFVNIISKGGFNFATLANNHIFNYCEEGIQDTKKYLNSVGIKAFGAGKNSLEASEILYVTEKEEKIAFINFAENEFNTVTQYHGGANSYCIVDIVNSIIEAKKKADYVFLIIHGGIDYCKIPSERMVKVYRFFADFGVSAIVGHHTHVVSGYEIYNDVPIFYGIGNFIPGKMVNKDVLFSFPVQFETIENGRVKFQGFPLKFNKDIGQLEILKDNEYEDFLKAQKKISNLLKDLNNLKETLKKEYLTVEREGYYFTLFTRSNYLFFKIMRKLKLIKLYHMFMLKKMKLNKKNTDSWNILRCETHRDVLDLIYEKYIDTYKNK